MDRIAPEAHQSGEFLKLLLKNRQALFAYIHSLVPTRADAEDILQEATATMMEKFSDFEPGSDFRAWAFRVAYWKVRQARQKFARSKLVFDDDVVAAVADTAEALGEETDARIAALGNCLEKLSERDRLMVLTRYEEGSDVRRAAELAGRSLQAGYRALGRIKANLRDCVEVALAAEAGGER